MIKKIIFCLMIIIPTCIMLFGCSFLGGGDSPNRVYIIKSEDYGEFKENIFRDNSDYEVPSVDELSAGEKYCIVVCTHAKTKDGSNLEFDNGSLKLTLIGSDVPIIQALDLKNASGLVAANETTLKFAIDPKFDAPEKKFTYCYEFTARGEGTLSAEYSLQWTAKKNFFINTRSATATVDMSFPKKVEFDDFSVRYLESGAYVDGRYNESDLKRTQPMTVGKDYYIVVTVKAESMFDENEGEKITLTLEHTASKYINSTLESADSGKHEEYTTEGGKLIRVSFNAPISDSGEKEIVCIFKISPLAAGSADLKLKFTSTDVGIVGQKSMDVRLGING